MTEPEGSVLRANEPVLDRWYSRDVTAIAAHHKLIAAPYFIDEKTLDSWGLLVSRTPQLARYINGASCLWIGRKKEAGKGLGWSNLKFDQISEK